MSRGGRGQQDSPPYDGYPPHQPTTIYYQQQTEVPIYTESDDKPPSNLLFSNKTIRAAFVRKVFGLVTAMLLVVVGFVALFTFQEDCRQFALENSWLSIISYVIFFVSILSIGCCEGLRRNYPGNIICLLILTLSLSFMTAMIAASIEKLSVLIAVGVAVLCCGSVVLFSCQSKYDFTSCMGVAYVAGMCLMFFGIFAIFFTLFLPQFSYVYLIYAFLAVFLMMIYLAIDIQLILGGRRFELGPEEYILGAVMLFVDVVTIFLYLLQIITSLSSNQ